MRKLGYSFIICLLTTQFSSAQNFAGLDEKYIESSEIKLTWMPTYKQALNKSRKEKKPVLIYFTGSDWCGPCKILDKTLFHTEKFKAIADKDLILLEVDIPRRIDLLSAKQMRHNKNIQEIYNVRSFPTVMIVNYKGKKIAEKKGYILTEYYYPFLRLHIEKY
tara:strand:- start:590 stop:1078 length:489 start_codon:yes stop_codon:yes gene_type:complete